jgi:hypothetical protein
MGRQANEMPRNLSGGSTIDATLHEVDIEQPHTPKIDWGGYE